MKKRALEAILHWLVLSCLYMYLFAGVAFVKQHASLIVCFPGSSLVLPHRNQWTVPFTGQSRRQCLSIFGFQTSFYVLHVLMYVVCLNVPCHDFCVCLFVFRRGLNKHKSQPQPAILIGPRPSPNPNRILSPNPKPLKLAIFGV